MKRAIVTTTINPPTQALKQFAKIATKDGWGLIIVGDKKTPDSAYKKFCQQYECAAYLDCKTQEVMSKELSDAIGWNCIQRRNFGLLAAYLGGAEVIATVDDDNIPFDDWGRDCLVGTDSYIHTYQTEAEVFDPVGMVFPHLWHRGFPIGLLDRRNKSTPSKLKRRVLVQADMWDGAPDIDAVCRITLNPSIRFEPGMKPFASNKIGPFNSQNTFLSREVFPTYFLFPHIGRMDDIWASYAVQHKHPDSVIYNRASVWQDRNPHDLTKDLEAEMLGYKHSFDVATQPNHWLQYLPKESTKAYEIWKRLLTK